MPRKATAALSSATDLINRVAAEVEEFGANTHSISFPDKTWQVIESLANLNTEGNRSRLLAMLAHQAAMMPETFGLKTEQDEEEGTRGKLAQRGA
jgi:hypothetical protein